MPQLSNYYQQPTPEGLWAAAKVGGSSKYFPGQPEPVHPEDLFAASQRGLQDADPTWGMSAADYDREYKRRKLQGERARKDPAYMAERLAWDTAILEKQIANETARLKAEALGIAVPTGSAKQNVESQKAKSKRTMGQLAAGAEARQQAFKESQAGSMQRSRNEGIARRQRMEALANQRITGIMPRRLQEQYAALRGIPLAPPKVIHQW